MTDEFLSCMIKWQLAEEKKPLFKCDSMSTICDAQKSIV